MIKIALCDDEAKILDEVSSYLSSKIKKNDGYINRIICGKKDPSFEALFDIASALKVTVAELFE